MPHRRIIIEVWGSTPGWAQEEVDRIIRFLKYHEQGMSSAFIDPHSYGEDFKINLHEQAGEGSIGAVLKEDFDYYQNKIRREDDDASA